MIRIRLRRVGAKKQPSYRIVAADSRAARDGRFLEIVGFFNPRTDPPTVKIKEELVLKWLEQGAQPTDAVRGLLEAKGTMARFARLRQGEPLEELLAEAEAAEAAAEQPSPKTRPIVARPAKVAEPEEIEAEAAEPEERVEEPEAEVEAEAEESEEEAEEPEAEAAVEAEAEVEERVEEPEAEVEAEAEESEEAAEEPEAAVTVEAEVEVEERVEEPEAEVEESTTVSDQETEVENRAEDT
jgi:small subunit ribosomal protein S16